LNPHDLAATGT